MPKCPLLYSPAFLPHEICISLGKVLTLYFDPMQLTNAEELLFSCGGDYCCEVHSTKQNKTEIHKTPRKLQEELTRSSQFWFILL